MILVLGHGGATVVNRTVWRVWMFNCFSVRMVEIDSK